MKRSLRRLRLLAQHPLAFVSIPLLTAAVRLVIVLSSVDRARKLFLPRELGTAAVATDVDVVARIVSSTARVIPDATCLTQALVLQILLARRHVDSSLCVGVRKDNEEAIAAHAWLEVADRTVIGGPKRGGPQPFSIIARLGPVR